MSHLTKVINQYGGKRESQLNETKTTGEKMSVLAHGRPVVRTLSMSQYTRLNKEIIGCRALETPENTTLVTWYPAAEMSTTLTGVGA